MVQGTGVQRMNARHDQVVHAGQPGEGRPRGSCRACGHAGVARVLEVSGLAMDLCPNCALAQLADGVGGRCEPIDTPREHVVAAVRTADAADLLQGNTVREFGGSHGGRWLPLLIQLGLRPVHEQPADVVVDSFGLAHEADQRGALHRLATATAPEGILLIQYQCVADAIRRGDWNMLHPNHFAYYSLTALMRLLAGVGMSVIGAWDLEMHGGSVLIAAIHAGQWPVDGGVSRMLADEQQLKITAPEAFSALQVLADRRY